MAKIMFIYPDTGGSKLNFSPAIEILSAYLKDVSEGGTEVALIHLSNQASCHAVLPDDYEEIYKRVSDFDPDVVGITSITFQYPIACAIAKALKERGWKKLVVLGGIHATIAPQDLKESPFDAFVIGEGEITLAALLHSLENGDDITAIKGLNIKQGNSVVENGYPQVLQDLDELPKWDYEVMNAKAILECNNGWFSTAFSRGCPYQCSFCINQKLKKEYAKAEGRGYYRCQSAKRAIENLLSYIKEYPGIRVFNFDDDLLIMDKKWFQDFATSYREKIYESYRIPYVINTRANFIDREVVGLLQSSGCYECQVGFETGNEEMRNRVLLKGISNKQLEQAFSLFHAYHIRSLAYTMIGIPGESLSTIRETVQMLAKLKPTLIRMTFFEPYIGTPLYDYCMEHGLFEDAFGNENNFAKSMVKMENISNEELVRYHLLFPWYLNLDLGLEQSIMKQYEDMVQAYAGMDYRQLISNEAKQSVLRYDRAIHEEMSKEHIPHFCYYEKNKNYFQYWEYVPLES